MAIRRIRFMQAAALFLPVLLNYPITLVAPALGANCQVTSVGLIPVNDLGSGTYQGEEGGLYPQGANERPPAHDAAGRALAGAIAPIGGRIVFISIGMSNTTQEFSRFVQLAMNYPGRNPDLLVVDCAVGGQHAAIAADPNSPYWGMVRQRLQAAGVDSSQVQIAWVKEAVANPTLAFPQDALELKGYLRAIAMNLTDKFPNIRLAFYSSRIYAGYAQGVSSLNPEPWAYQSGFAVKWLIEDQITATDPGLNYNPQNGPVESPWLAWGPYLWADGLVPRSDGLTWECSNFQNDGTHPSTSGREKVAAMLLHFFTTDPTATPWFLAGETGVGQHDGSAPQPHLLLGPVEPNPMTTQAMIPLEVAGDALVSVMIHDAAGRLVRVIHRGELAGGRHELRWDGADESGRPVASGIYFMLARDGRSASRLKLTVAR